jgi:predicted small lipoprotein YifL
MIKRLLILIMMTITLSSCGHKQLLQAPGENDKKVSEVKMCPYVNADKEECRPLSTTFIVLDVILTLWVSIAVLKNNPTKKTVAWFGFAAGFTNGILFAMFGENFSCKRKRIA